MRSKLPLQRSTFIERRQSFDEARSAALLKYRIETSGCWTWLGAITNDGYGRLKIKGKHFVAHRVFYEEHIGPIPQGLGLDHLCRNRGCVNPRHLEPVTNVVNVLRGEGITAENARKTHCNAGHPLVDDNLYIYHGKRYCKHCQYLRVIKFRGNRTDKNMIPSQCHFLEEA